MRRFSMITVLVTCMAVLMLSGCTESGTISDTQAAESSTQGDETEMETKAAHTGTAYTGSEYAGAEYSRLNLTDLGEGRAPYAVKTILREYTVADPESGIGAYGRYTELIVEDGAPDTLKSAAADYNQKAEASVKSRADALVGDGGNAVSFDHALTEDEQADLADIQYAAFACIVTLTRADDTAFSFLEAELETDPSGKRGALNGSEYTCHFFGHTYETKTGEEILLSDLIDDEGALKKMLDEALCAQYRVEELARTDSSDYTWTADVLGLRFYFNSEAVSDDKRHETGDYSGSAVTAAIPYTALQTEKSAFLADVPDTYIAQMDIETVYDLPYGDMSVMITEKDGQFVFRRMPDQGEAEDLIIEYGDIDSDYYIIRSMDGFYLYRERIGYQEGFFYDFSRPDGGYGRFAYNTAQYFDSYMHEIGLAVAYNPRCVHMSEKKRSFGKESYDASSFFPGGHYTFPDEPDARYKLFMLTDEALSIDSYNVACRLLEDFNAVKIDEAGNETGEMTVSAGSAMILEAVSGEGRMYLTPPQRSDYSREYIYDCRLADGTRVRFISVYESTLMSDGANMNRFTEPVALWEAQFIAEPKAAEVFTVEIGGKAYPLIPDYSKDSHVGEEIDFGDDLWWQAEGFVGRYVMTDDDVKEMTGEYDTQDALSHTEGTAVLEISEDGHVVFDYFGTIFEGDLSQKRYYHTYVAVAMRSPEQNRSFQIRLREGAYHSVPEKIEVYSEGEPATNEPSRVPPMSVFLTRE